jgi:hypothetical protein
MKKGPWYVRNFRAMKYFKCFCQLYTEYSFIEILFCHKLTKKKPITAKIKAVLVRNKHFW